MESLMLSLRQRKLLHYLKSRKLYTTGEELANHLHVSSRTIRNEINDALRSYGIRVISKRSIGYLLEADDPDTLKRLSQASSSFLSRDERVRHIAFQLSLYDEPLDLYDLEDEMFVSRTTLEHDLGALRKQYIPSPTYGSSAAVTPFISRKTSGNAAPSSTGSFRKTGITTPGEIPIITISTWMRMSSI